jgi:hypothetical protein
MLEYIPCYDGPAEHWGLLPATRLTRREILIEQNIKKQTGSSLCVLCGPNSQPRTNWLILFVCTVLYIHTVLYVSHTDRHNTWPGKVAALSIPVWST